jgi:branched-chain amino acid transport system ATP-binding protein
MLAIGRGLMMNPRILLLDEPSMGLSPLLCDHIFTAIERLNRDRGLTILLVEQNANLALSVAHRGYLIQQGSMVLSGTVSDLLQNNNVRSVYLGA